jgi:hypothetical protein
MLRIDARPGIANRDQDAIRLRLLGADQQRSRPRLDRTHCFDCVAHQVQSDLLQLNTIPLYGKQPIRKAGLDQNLILDDYRFASPAPDARKQRRSVGHHGRTAASVEPQRELQTKLNDFATPRLLGSS